jgi:CheY-like chemotaxis protein
VPAWLRGDATRLRQALLNYASNAVKFTEQGTVSLRARLLREEDGRVLVRFEVQDTGIGIAADKLPGLFEPFVQADTSTTRRFGGTGLGLAITRRFCEMMGGTVSVESEAGRGSTFTIRLPAESMEGAGRGAPGVKRDSETAPHSAPRTPHLVLVIDDDETVRDMLARTLGQVGMQVVTAASGEAGLRCARESHPAAITLDVMMPGMDGWTVLSALKADPELAAIPVIMLTVVEDRSHGFALGAADYLVKPVDRERLVAVLKRYAHGPQPPSVLVVEDDAATREVMRRALEKEGWTVREAENGQAGLARLGEGLPALILLDLLMPVMDGFEFIAALRAQEDWRGVPVVVVTSKDLTANDRLRLNGQVEKVLLKGAYSREALLADVRALVTRLQR